MDENQQKGQRRDFAVTKAKLEQLKHDPSISVDEFISKMLVFSLEQSNSALRKPTNFSYILPETTVDVKPSFDPLNVDKPSDPDDTWGNFRSSSDTNTLSKFFDPVDVGSTAIDVAFNEFDSFESFMSPSSNPKLELNVALSRSIIPNVQDTHITSQSGPFLPKSTAAAVELFDEFSDFVSSQKPIVSPNNRLNHFTIAKPVESLRSLFPTILTDKKLAAEPALQEAQAAGKDGFDDFQSCVFKTAPPPLELPRKKLPTESWMKCLSECRSMLLESASILSPLVTESDTDAFLSTSRGNEYIYELIEIYGICQRIRLAASINSISDSQLQTIFNQIDQTWSDLAKFMKNREHKQTLRLRLAQSIKATTATDALSVEPNCGVCVTPVYSSLSSSSLSFRSDPGIAVICLAGRVYHASCANLWVNRIELSLPALRAS